MHTAGGGGTGEVMVTSNATTWWPFLSVMNRVHTPGVADEATSIENTSDCAT